jgi:hypothetical protein
MDAAASPPERAGLEDWAGLAHRVPLDVVNPVFWGTFYKVPQKLYQ